MTAGRWARLEALFHAAAPLPSDERQALLALECGDDAALRDEAERLLAAHDRAGGFIQAPAVATSAMAEPGEALPAGRRVGAYRLVREIGRGGMGAVYLAERDDGAFSQRVAIKLIKRGMDTDQVLARFRAERQILASLDHPNIARLLDGGTTDDGLPYFAMEYIAGQPIDAYADARRLPIADRLRLFLQVCDAVAHAHDHGVIHRDIKPLNILVTPAGVPKLLDFGIAKVLHDAGEEVTSTVTGLRLLTPEYASPEQVEGRHATAVSDVYALGVVLYELLAGRSPYRLPSRTPQDVAAAVCTTYPERPSAAVTRAPDASESEGKSRRRHGGSAAEHAAAAGGVTPRQLSRLLRGDLDTVVLMALRKEPARRYPSVERLAEDLRRHLDGRPVRARADGVFYRFGKLVRRRRAALAAAALAAGAGLLAARGLPATRGEAAGPTLFDSRALALRDRILVADFADRTGDTTLAAAVTEAVRTDLAQSPVLRVLTPRQVRASLELMQRPSDVVLDDTLAREVALREGVKAFVTGSLSRLAGTYVVNVQLVSAQGGDALTAVRETAEDSTRLIAAVDRASKTLRRRVGESLRDLEQTPSLDQATTASLPALRKYTEGMRLLRAGERTAAVKRLEEAVALDTGFATAHSSLAMVYGALNDIGRSYASGNHALANQRRLGFLERSFLLASRAYANEDYRAAIEVYTAVLGRYPDNVPAMNNLALAYRDGRRYAQAESLFRRAIEADSSIANMYFGVHSAQLLQGRFADARATLDLAARRFPDNPVLGTEEIQDAAARQDWTRAEREARLKVRAAGTDTVELVDPIEALAGLWMLQGRLAQAERGWRDQLVTSRASGAMGRHLFGVIQLAYLDLRYRDAPARAVALADSARATLPAGQLLPGDRRYYELARLYAAAGARARARGLLDSAIADDRTLGRESRAERSWTRGVLALAEGRLPAAISELNQAAAVHVCEICPLPDLGRALEAAGRSGEAAEAYGRYLTTPWLWRYEPDAVELGWVTRRLAELYEASGEPAAAARLYGRLLRLWGAGDPVLRPAVEEVRERLEALSEAGAGARRAEAGRQGPGRAAGGAAGPAASPGRAR